MSDAGSDGSIRQVATRVVHQTAWMSVREDQVVFPDGTPGTYSVVDKDDFAVVLPYADGGFWLVQQFRYPIGRRVWEFPQGSWTGGAAGSPVQLAAAELREETGLVADELTHLGRLYASYGYCSQAFDVFLADGLTAGAPQREATEADMVHEWHPEAAVRAMLARGEFVDGGSVAALTLLDQHRRSG